MNFENAVQYYVKFINNKEEELEQKVQRLDEAKNILIKYFASVSHVSQHEVKTESNVENNINYINNNLSAIFLVALVRQQYDLVNAILEYKPSIINEPLDLQSDTKWKPTPLELSIVVKDEKMINIIKENPHLNFDNDVFYRNTIFHSLFETYTSQKDSKEDSEDWIKSNTNSLLARAKITSEQINGNLIILTVTHSLQIKHYINGHTPKDDARVLREIEFYHFLKDCITYTPVVRSTPITQQSENNPVELSTSDYGDSASNNQLPEMSEAQLINSLGTSTSHMLKGFSPPDYNDSNSQSTSASPTPESSSLPDYGDFASSNNQLPQINNAQLAEPLRLSTSSPTRGSFSLPESSSDSDNSNNSLHRNKKSDPQFVPPARGSSSQGEIGRLFERARRESLSRNSINAARESTSPPRLLRKEGSQGCLSEQRDSISNGSPPPLRKMGSLGCLNIGSQSRFSISGEERRDSISNGSPPPPLRQISSLSCLNVVSGRRESFSSNSPPRSRRRSRSQSRSSLSNERGSISGLSGRVPGIPLSRSLSRRMRPLIEEEEDMKPVPTNPKEPQPPSGRFRKGR